jgi:methylase of polypeptide subunit release factors
MSQVNLWTSAEHALSYLAKADSVPQRTEGEAVLLGEVPKTVKRILDVGTGDGRLLGLLKCDRPNVECVDRLFTYNVGKS